MMILVTSEVGAGKTPSIPYKMYLMSRIDLFYKALGAQDWKTVLSIMSPEIQKCSSVEELQRDFMSGKRGALISWKIKKLINMNDTSGEITIECTGELFKIESAALVHMLIRSQRPDGKEVRIKYADGWLYASNEWYWSGGGESID